MSLRNVRQAGLSRQSLGALLLLSLLLLLVPSGPAASCDQMPASHPCCCGGDNPCSDQMGEPEPGCAPAEQKARATNRSASCAPLLTDGPALPGAATGWSTPAASTSPLAAASDSLHLVICSLRC